MFKLGFILGMIATTILAVTFEGLFFSRHKKETIARWRRRQPHGIKKSCIADYFPINYFQPPDFLPASYSRRKRVKEPFPVINMVSQLNKFGTSRMVRIGGIWR